MSGTTTTTTYTSHQISLHGGRSSAPKKLAVGISKHALLDTKQAGHIRHFHNLASQPDGEWALMGAAEPAQEWLIQYRREVWGYWYLTSQSGIRVNPDIKELRKPWADPVVRENIMYSGHLLLMTTLYAMLFDDDKYEEDGALAFSTTPYSMEWDRKRTLITAQHSKQLLSRRWRRMGGLGVAVNRIRSLSFVTNFRYNDVRKGTNEVERLLEKYQNAWENKNSMFGKDGFLVDIYMTQQQYKYNSGSLGFSAWAGAMINSWNPEQAHATYNPQTCGFLTRKKDGRINLNPPPIAHSIRKIVTEDKTLDPTSEEAQKLAWPEFQKAPAKKPMLPYHNPTFGYVIEYTSEVAEDPSILQGLLKHADDYMAPTWSNGGLYYKRCDVLADEHGNHTQVDPFTGNSAIGYSRLNVIDGQRKMWEAPWTSDKVRNDPFVDGVGFADGVDFLRAVWDEEARAFVLSVRSWNGESIMIEPKISNLPSGSYGIYVDEALTGEIEIQKGDVIPVSIMVNGDLKDVVVVLLAMGE